MGMGSGWRSGCRVTARAARRERVARTVPEHVTVFHDVSVSNGERVRQSR
jgi:hypothetical protein